MTRFSDLALQQIAARPGYGVREGRTINTDAVGSTGCKATVSTVQPTPDAPVKPPGTRPSGISPAAQSGHPTEIQHAETKDSIARPNREKHMSECCDGLPRVDGQQERFRLRENEDRRSIPESTSRGIHVDQRGDTERHGGDAHMRQQVMLQPGTPTSGNTNGQRYRRHPEGPNAANGSGLVSGKRQVAGPLTPPTSCSAGGTSQEDQAGKPRATGAALTLPWPPSGNHAHGHFDNQRFLRAEVIAYRDTVEHLCAGKGCIVSGRYRLHVHMSPPDARERDMDNALKQLFDALKRCYLHSDSMVYMRELLVTTDDDRLNHVRVRAVAI